MSYLLARIVFLDQGNQPSKPDQDHGGSSGAIGRVAVVCQEVQGLAGKLEGLPFWKVDVEGPAAGSMQEGHHRGQEGQRDDGVGHVQAEHHVDVLHEGRHLVLGRWWEESWRTRLTRSERDEGDGGVQGVFIGDGRSALPSVFFVWWVGLLCVNEGERRGVR